MQERIRLCPSINGMNHFDLSTALWSSRGGRGSGFYDETVWLLPNCINIIVLPLLLFLSTQQFCFMQFHFFVTLS